MAGKKKRIPTQREVEAGARNLAKWEETHPEHGNLRHGAYSRHVRQRYSDERTTEGKRLKTILRKLALDLGPELSTSQCLLLDRIREKLIVLMQIGAYVDKQESIITEKGELIGCLGRGYTSFSEALRRDLEALHATSKKTSPLSYEEAVKKLTEGQKQ